MISSKKQELSEKNIFIGRFCGKKKNISLNRHVFRMLNEDN